MEPVGKAKFVEKDWGSETWMANNDTEDYCGKLLHIKEGHSSSMHYHMDKHETFYILDGQLMVNLIDTSNGTKRDSIIMSQGETLEINRGQPHQLIAHKGDVTFFEASTFHKDEDSYRVSRGLI